MLWLHKLFLVAYRSHGRGRCQGTKKLLFLTLFLMCLFFEPVLYCLACLIGANVRPMPKWLYDPGKLAGRVPARQLLEHEIFRKMGAHIRNLDLSESPCESFSRRSTDIWVNRAEGCKRNRHRAVVNRLRKGRFSDPQSFEMCLSFLVVAMDGGGQNIAILI